MKAKEYFRIYKEENKEKIEQWRFITALRNMILEIDVIAKKRNTNNDEALISIFKEQRLKAISFIKKVNTHLKDDVYKLDSFELVLKDQSLDLYNQVFNTKELKEN